MPDVVVPTAPALATVPNVELMHTGEWAISTGIFDFTSDDLRAAVASQDCPAVRRPVLKLGHTDPRFDGEPAVGWVGNMAVAEDGRTLVGDYTGMPGWLGDVIASAFPDRSIEGEYDFRCQMGHIHPFVITACALLGVAQPGIGTLASLQDVATLYGVVAASSSPTSPAGTPVAITITDDQEVPVPNPNPLKVAASVTSEDVRRAFYSSDAGRGWDIWIEEMQLDPLQLIAMDDSTGKRSRIPVIVGAGDGEDAVTFGDPVQVVIRYEDAAADTAVAASAASKRLSWASRDESRPGKTPTAPKPPTATAAGSSTTTQEGSLAVPFDDEQLTTLRQKLGVAEDADEATILGALDEALAERAEPQTPTTVPPGTVVIDEATHADLVAAATQGREARQQQLREERERLVSAAVNDGRIPPVRKDAWLQMLESDPGSKDVLASLKPVVPVTASGHDGGNVAASAAGDAAYDDLYPTEQKG